MMAPLQLCCCTLILMMTVLTKFSVANQCTESCVKLTGNDSYAPPVVVEEGEPAEFNCSRQCGTDASWTVKFPSNSGYTCGRSPSDSGYISCIHQSAVKNDIRPEVILTNESSWHTPCIDDHANDTSASKLYYDYRLIIQNVTKALHGTIVLCGVLLDNDERRYLYDMFVLVVEERISIIPSPTVSYSMDTSSSPVPNLSTRWSSASPLSASPTSETPTNTPCKCPNNTREQFIAALIVTTLLGGILLIITIIVIVILVFLVVYLRALQREHERLLINYRAKV